MREKNQFYCIGSHDKFGNPTDLKLFGNYEQGVFKTISITFRPCVPKQRIPASQTFDGKEDNRKCLVNDLQNKTEME